MTVNSKQLIENGNKPLEGKDKMEASFGKKQKENDIAMYPNMKNPESCFHRPDSKSPHYCELCGYPISLFSKSSNKSEIEFLTRMHTFSQS